MWGDPLGLAGGFELGHELASAVDLDGLHREGHVGCDFVEQACGGLGCGAVERFGDGPFGDRIVGGEVLDRLGGGEIDEDGVELDEAAGLAHGESARQALGRAGPGRKSRLAQAHQGA